MSEVTKKSDNSSSQMRLLGGTPHIPKSNSIFPQLQGICEKRKNPQCKLQVPIVRYALHVRGLGEEHHGHLVCCSPLYRIKIILKLD